MNKRLPFPTWRSGMAIPLAVLGVLMVAFFVSTMASLNKGMRAGLQHLNVRQHMFNVAFAGYSRVLAQLYEKPWEDRSFKTAPQVENNVAFDGSTYDLYVTNTTGKNYQIDIYLRVKHLKEVQVFFWRVAYVDDILDVSGRIYPIVFMDIEPQFFPGAGSSLDAVIADILQKRQQNQDKAMQKASVISHLGSVNDVAMVFPAKEAGETLPEPPFGTRNPQPPAPPDLLDGQPPGDVATGKKLSDPPAPKPEYSGPLGFGDRGSGTRVAVNDGTASVNGRCIDESGTRILVIAGGKTVFSWASSQDHSFTVLDKERQEKKKKALEEGKDPGKYNDHDMFRKNFNVSIPLKAGQKVKVFFVGRKTCKKLKSWMNLNGPF